ncbi:MAG TPA: hypothetical protein PK597_00540 [Oscillospiraceae bacterium]|nr:hypothetical protein [Oscillospiraceae bacterium]
MALSSDFRPTFFLGANAGGGFASLYEEILGADLDTVLLLKGGPGCGKSSFLRRVASRLEAAGHPAEYIACSGDPDSLDAAIFPSLGAAVADATAPHVLEPTMPGAVERYVDLGAFYDCAALRGKRAELAPYFAGCRLCFERTYRLLAAACGVRETGRALLFSEDLAGRLRRRAAGVAARELKKGGGPTGGVKRRFLGAVTAGGVLCRFDTARFYCPRLYILEDTWGLADAFLRPLSAAATASGRDVIECPDPLCPERLAHLLVPALGLGFVSSSPVAPYDARPYRRIRLDAAPDAAVRRAYRARLRFSKRLFSSLLDESVEALAQAKAQHDDLEAAYNPHVDFAGVYALADETAGMLLAR